MTEELRRQQQSDRACRRKVSVQAVGLTVLVSVTQHLTLPVTYVISHRTCVLAPNGEGGEGEGGGGGGKEGGEEETTNAKFLEETHPQRPTTNPIHSIPK